MDTSPFNGDTPVDLKRARRRKSVSTASLIDRLPPHSPEAEKGVLGCCMISPNDCIGQCALLLPDKEAFYDLRHQTIYTALVDMFDAREPIDLITLHQWLKDRQLLEQAGGISYLSQLERDIASSANLTYYTGIVYEKYLLRKLIHTCSGAVGKVYEFEGEVDTLLDEVERDIMKIRTRRGAKRADIKVLVNSAIGIIEEKFTRQGAISGLSTGFTDLDRYTDGLVAGELIVPAAYPGIGKTSLLMNMVENIVLVQKLPAAIFSMEMTAEQLVTRFLCSTAKVNLKRIGSGFMAEADFPKLTSAAGRTSASKLYIIDDVETIGQIRAESRRLKQEHNVAMIGVDYIQRVRADSGDNREQEVANISSGLKSIAKELKLPVVAPSQLNEDGKLRESRAIGQDADQIWMMESQDESKTEDSEAVDLWIRKNRNGPRDVCVHLSFLKEFTRFEPASKVADEDVPKSRRHND